MFGTYACYTQHIKRAVYQDGYCWAQMVIKVSELPSPNEWGWKTDEGWEVDWTTLPEAAQACRELINCSCKKELQRSLQVQEGCFTMHITLLLW